MTDSAGTNPVPGTEVTTTPGLLPDPITGIDPNITLDTGVDPAYAHAYPPAGDGSTFTIDLPPASHAPHPEMIDRLESIERKLDHLLEHQHQPLHGTIHIDSPPKTPAGVTGDVTELG
jgi:hypothetical protein|tara:strand:- start:146 stop:499 length:354 start_codon:yes stop_codon:yes gene_type:complete